MNVLFTGSSSFTGYWIVKELADAGCQVTAIYQKSFHEYDGVRKKRVEQLQNCSHQVFGCSFGSPVFFDLISSTSFDVFCHHGADVTNYKSPDFNYLQAVKSNTYQVEKVIKTLLEKGCSRIHLTGSVFEQGEGESTQDLIAVSPYGLSKGITSDIFHYFATQLGMRYTKFVIPNPFGPYEDKRFTSYLMDCWKNNVVADVRTPEYVRDNIPVTLLAEVYVLSVLENRSYCAPKGYSESQGEFTARVAKEVAQRTSLPCEFTLAKHQEFSEPIVRLNREKIEDIAWDETCFWNEFVEYYEV